MKQAKPEGQEVHSELHSRLHFVARFEDLPKDRGTRVTVGDTPILLVRQQERVLAFSADCPHAGAPLEKGAVCNGRIVCPWHKGTFDATDGRLIEPPALSGLKRYAVVVEHGEVKVSEREMSAATKPIAVPEAKPQAKPQAKLEAAPGGQRSAEPAGHEAVAPGEQVIAIIGGGAAGAAACATLRDNGFTGKLIVIGPEQGAPYDRTALSKFVLAGDMPPDDIPPLLSPSYFSRHGIDRVESDVRKLDADSKQIDLSNGLKLRYHTALICTGGIARPITLAGSRLQRVHLLRNRDDARAILPSLRQAKSAVIIGASFIGLEVASCLRKRHIDVTVVTPDDVPLKAQFGDTLGAMFQRLHEANGVTFRLSSQVKALHGVTAVAAAELESGEMLQTDVVIVGTGVRPATDFLRDLRLADDGGVPVDASMRAAPGLFAAGDIAQFPLPRTDEPVRIEHWRVAQQQGRIAALNMMGGDIHYTGVPYFWTYHFGKRLEYLGHAKTPNDVVVDGDLEQQCFVAYLMEADKVAAVVACENEAQTARLAEGMREPLTLSEARRIVAAHAK